MGSPSAVEEARTRELHIRTVLPPAKQTGEKPAAPTGEKPAVKDAAPAKAP